MPETQEADALYTTYRDGEPESKTAIMLIDETLFDICDPSTWVFNVDTIATSLSNLCRFNGHCRFYSVAEHSVRVSELLEQWGASAKVQYLGLHHDDIESVLGDVPSPLKRITTLDGEAFKDVETEVEVVYFDAIGILATFEDFWDDVKEADLAIYLKERDERPNMGVGYLPQEGKELYLRRHNALIEQLGESVNAF